MSYARGREERTGPSSLLNSSSCCCTALICVFQLLELTAGLRYIHVLLFVLCCSMDLDMEEEELSASRKEKETGEFATSHSWIRSKKQKIQKTQGVAIYDRGPLGLQAFLWND